MMLWIIYGLQTEADIAMEVRDSIEKRRSIRKFKNTPVEQKE